MDKHELADEYISKVKEDYHPYLGSGTGLLSLALLRVCEELLEVQREYARYRILIRRERQAELAEALGIYPDLMDKVELIVRQATSQNRACEGQTPPRPDPQSTPVTPHQPSVWHEPDTGMHGDPPDSTVGCPNCGEWAELVRVSTETVIKCFECDYEEVR